ncbi:EamA family transporter [Nanohaloarchaea archaeon]|nr:EamA family transporter [Candidatus Nanohaloarchaea archaeon]
MQLWMILGFISAVGWASVVLLNKFVVDSEVNDTLFSGSMHSLFNCVTIAVSSALSVGLPSLGLNALAGSIMGVLFIVANYLWFSGVGEEDVSRFAPVLSLDVAFIAVLSLVLLGESFSPVAYVGMAVTIVGCVFISLENPIKSFSKLDSRYAVLAAIGSAFIYSIREVFFQYASSGISTWPILFYYGLTGSIMSILLLKWSDGDIIDKVTGSEHLALSGSLSGIAQVIFFIAISLGSASIVSTITKSRFIMVFLVATTVSRLHPEILHEELDRSILIQKTLGLTMISVGIVAATSPNLLV